ncbi:MAG: hypothetical protein H6604_07865 [Flavobacteriales bacterium]|nr:hypothetical protein [Flavobacteriales bacterium]
MISYTIQIPENKKSFFEELLNAIPFVKRVDSVEKESPYNSEFIKKIEESKKQYKQGKFSSVNNEKELKELLGL